MHRGRDVVVRRCGDERDVWRGCDESCEGGRYSLCRRAIEHARELVADERCSPCGSRGVVHRQSNREPSTFALGEFIRCARQEHRFAQACAREK